MFARLSGRHRKMTTTFMPVAAACCGRLGTVATLSALAFFALGVWAGRKYDFVKPRASMPGHERRPTTAPKAAWREQRRPAAAASLSSPTVRLVLSAFAGLQGPRYFVDLAANHPTTGSNTYELETSDWSGLCIEPNPKFVTMLKAKRKCAVAQSAVDSEVRSVTFRLAGEMGGIEDDRFDNRAENRSKASSGSRAQSLTLQTRLLTEVLETALAPNVIDYMSLDVEGAESAVLCPDFAWNKFTFLMLSIERPPPDLNARLFRHGYTLSAPSPTRQPNALDE